MLGYISIEQSDLFKVLTIVSVMGVPPTLLAGIWGMNFKEMPELGWAWGYPLAWLSIILSAVLPLWWFKRRGMVLAVATPGLVLRHAGAIFCKRGNDNGICRHIHG